MTVSLRFIKWVSISALAITLSLVSIATTQTTTTFQGPTAEPPDGNVDLSCDENEAINRIGGEGENKVGCTPNLTVSCHDGDIPTATKDTAARGGKGGYVLSCESSRLIRPNDIPTSCTDDQVVKYDETKAEWVCGSVPPLPQHCRGGTKALRWDSNANSWICGDIVTSTTATLPTPQDCRGGTKVLRWNAVTSSWICGNVATSTLATPPLCNGANKVLRWNGGNWICGTVQTAVSTPVTPVTPVNSDRTRCENRGGDYVVARDICFLPGGSCPTGWSQVQNWSTTSSVLCGQDDFPYPCATGGHTRQNRQRERCSPSVSYGGSIVSSGYTCSARISEVGCRKN